MDRLNALIQLNARNRSDLGYLIRLIREFAEENDVSVEFDGGEAYFYGLNDSQVSFVEQNILLHLIRTCPELFPPVS